MEGAHFVGLFISFPIDKNERGTGILSKLLRQQPLDFSKMEFGRLLGDIRKARFSENRLSDALNGLERGDIDWLQLYQLHSGGDWVKAYSDKCQLAWESSVIE